ncbi:MAG: aldolase [Candidatus Hydrogenedentes bacterium]|nr:aldolase [Candidatus Hydrogenedentota bacterium]
MYESLVLKKIRNNEPVWCAKSNLTDPNVVEIFGALGIHCVWLCMEHGPINLESVHNQVRAAKMMGMDSMVRVPKGSYSDFVRPLEMDATGIMVPHCMSGREAADIVRMTRFQPVGRRAWDGGNSDGPFCMRPPEEYLRFANEQRFLLVQIEDKEAVDCMEDIVATDGIDVIFLGPGDLSHSYGVPGQFDHPLVTAAVDKLAALCAKHGRHWGMPCGPEKAPELIAKGARFLAAGSDVTVIAAAMREMRGGYEAAGLTFEPRL